MWYEVLPPLLIIGACISLPGLISHHLNKLVSGHPQIRTYLTDFERLVYERDHVQGGFKDWNFNGLEAIPDK